MNFFEIPITSANTVKHDPACFFTPFVTPDQGTVSTSYTSGSTGEPLEVRMTQKGSAANAAENNRLYAPWRIPNHRKVLKVRGPETGNPAGTIKEYSYSAGAQHWKIYTVEGVAVADLLKQTRASFVTGLPSVLQAALECAPRLKTLKLVSTVGEILTDEFRYIVEAVPDRRLFDSYGCTEVGILAAQCPLCRAYHIADRHVLLEILNDDGSPTPPGEMGRVIVTPFYNQAMPLIRYEVGDYAVPSQVGNCVNGKFTLARILGRQKNIFTLPGGERLSPYFPAKEACRLGMKKFKLVQLSLEHVELHYVPLTDEIEVSPAVVQSVVDHYVSPKLKVTPVRVRDIPRAPSGKYLMHESMVQ